MKFNPSPRYEIEVPDDVRIDQDPQVLSIWRDEHCLLQLSSFHRSSGEQISADQRLKDRIDKTFEDWHLVNVEGPAGADLAVGSYTDSQNVEWFHLYFVWPMLTIYATISKGPGSNWQMCNWAFNSIRSIRLA